MTFRIMPLGIMGHTLFQQGGRENILGLGFPQLERKLRLPLFLPDLFLHITTAANKAPRRTRPTAAATMWMKGWGVLPGKKQNMYNPDPKIQP